MSSDHALPDPYDEMLASCSVCRKTDEQFNLRSEHWGICNEHGLKWPIGDNLFSYWRFETEAIWIANFYRLRQFRLAHRVGEPQASADASNERLARCHLLEIPSKWYVIERLEAGEGALRLVGGPFASRRGAELFREDLGADWSHGHANKRNSPELRMIYDRVAALMEICESEGVSDPRALADKMIALRSEPAGDSKAGVGLATAIDEDPHELPF